MLLVTPLNSQLFDAVLTDPKSHFTSIRSILSQTCGSGEFWQLSPKKKYFIFHINIRRMLSNRDKVVYLIIFGGRFSCIYLKFVTESIACDLNSVSLWLTASSKRPVLVAFEELVYHYNYHQSLLHRKVITSWPLFL